jgi:molybdopterin converting factor small subunit
MKVNLPTPLVDYTGGRRDVVAGGATLDELLRDLDRQYPGIRFRMIDEQGRVRPHIKLFVDRELQRDLSVALSAESDVMIVAALSGG